MDLRPTVAQGGVATCLVISDDDANEVTDTDEAESPPPLAVSLGAADGAPVQSSVPATPVDMVRSSPRSNGDWVSEVADAAATDPARVKLVDRADIAKAVGQHLAAGLTTFGMVADLTDLLVKPAHETLLLVNGDGTQGTDLCLGIAVATFTVGVVMPLRWAESATLGVCDRRGGGGGDVGGLCRCVTVVGELTDGGEADATVVTVAMVDRGEQDPPNTDLAQHPIKTAVMRGSVKGTIVKRATVAVTRTRNPGFRAPLQGIHL